ncbi:AT DNA binding protein [Pseudozyma hubeiensis SY62]|uniref:AT DNA binding protein n=1 Tax=Pseudozyma hubeiensis (strain SY62) TaxID=1305764 RepID=R9PDC8_PSEHS|nr:AT DNA binding protein [Pseudozyma hubeiensis SY62]GAC99346.1 AT DNA binding protein [Pseudozyma hubeiensis SY62]
MAARTVPGAAEKPVRRVVPGAPPPASAPSKSGKKVKGGANKDGAAVKVTSPASAALLEEAPENPNQVANGLKVTAQDLAEEAETQAAVAAVEAIETSKPSTVASTPAQKVISERITELMSKNKNATITVAVDELKTLLKKVSQAESLSTSSSAPVASTDSDSKAHLILLLQFLHLFNLFHPNPAGPSTFAPTRSMPPALEMSTGQQVAALARVYDQLANGPLEGGGGDALELLASIQQGSKDEVLPDVSFATLRSMIFKLTAPPAAAASEPKPKASGLDAPPADFVPLDAVSPSAAPVSFIQASEILDRSAEPEGGQPSTVPATGATESSKGKQGGSGIVLGEQSATSSKADGTAASAVQEPINTTVKSAAEPKLNWAALAEEDDDDLGEAPVFEPLGSSTTSALVTPAPGTPTAAEPEAAASTAAKPPPSAEAAESPLSPKPKKSKQNGGSKGNAGARNGNGKASGAAPPPTPKGPKVDEDGFILQESKKTKYLQQKQQQQQQQNRGNGGGRGGKGGANGGRGGRQNAGGGRAPKSGEARPSNTSGTQ